MKAKEYAAKIIVKADEALEYAKKNLADKSDEEYSDYLLEEMIESAIAAALTLIIEIKVASKSVNKNDSKFAKWREGISKWKSIVGHVHDKHVMHPVTFNYISLLLAEDNPELFELLVQKKCFLGYEFSDKEKEILAQLQDKRLKEESQRQQQASEAAHERMVQAHLFAMIFMDNFRQTLTSPKNPMHPENMKSFP